MGSGRAVVKVKKKGAVGRPSKMGRSDTWLGVLGENVRRARHRKSWSLIELSEKSGVEMTLLSEFERGMRDISVAELLRIISAIGVPVGKLVPRMDGQLDPSVVGSMSASWLAEVCKIVKRNVGGVLERVSENEQASKPSRKRNRVGA